MLDQLVLSRFFQAFRTVQRAQVRDAITYRVLVLIGASFVNDNSGPKN